MSLVNFYNYCSNPECDARKIYDDFMDYMATHQDEREEPAEEQNDKLFAAYTAAIAVILKAQNEYDMFEAKRWIKEHVQKHYPRGDADGGCG